MFCNCNRHSRYILLILVCCFLCVATIEGIPVQGSTDQIQKNTAKVSEVMQSILSAQTQETIPSYASYLDGFNDAQRPLTEVSVSYDFAESAGIESGTSPDGAQAIRLNDGDSVVFPVFIEKVGLYRLEISYFFDDSDSGESSGLLNPTISLGIDGKSPFREAQSLELRRLWKDSPIKQDSNGNDLVPGQFQIKQTVVAEMMDPSGLHGAYYFYLKEGKNELTVTVQDSSVYINSLCFYNREINTHEEYAKHNQRLNISSKDTLPPIQAETPLLKNDPSLTPSIDRSSSGSLPNDPVALRLNIISGTNYKIPGQMLVWQVTVPEDGAYRLGARYRQNFLEGIFVNRELKIDGETPFEEFRALRFGYSGYWQYKEFEQTVFLNAGEHTISLVVSDSEMSSAARRLKDCIYVLNYLYRRIIMITGVNVDTNRDFMLDSEIPELLPAFAECADELDKIYDETTALTKTKGGRFSVLSQFSNQLKELLEQPDNIAYRLSYYKSNISALSSLLMALQQQPLDIDYITLRGTAAPKFKSEPSFLSNFTYHLKAFIGSFINDYASVGADAKSNNAESLKVWFGGSREQAEVIKRMTDSGFTQKYGVPVDMKLVQIPITQAVLAGQAPDVVLNVGREQPVNLGARGILADLSVLPGFSEAAAWFNNDACLPYQYKNAVYGLPVTLNYCMMFYREDIFGELNLKIPETWDEFYKLIPKIQKANMQVGLPVSSLSAQSGLPSEILSMFLLQNGGSYYDHENREILMDARPFIESFKAWTELYSLYGFDIDYNFYNRFRNGEMPLGIQNYSMYNMLSAAAPEIDGLWEMTVIPGTLRDDGTVDRSQAPSGTAAVILKNTKWVESAWELVKWWCSPDAQALYGNQIEMLMGKAARYNPASDQAVKQLSWTKTERMRLLEQKKELIEIPEVIGGYFTNRGIDFAFRNVVLSGKNYREELLEQQVIINNELRRKRKEFGID